jgi:hypothetical protein
MRKEIGHRAIKLANECFAVMAKEERCVLPICKAYSGMNCIHPRHLPSCEGCNILRHYRKEKEHES